MTRPKMPCTEVRTPEHGNVYIDATGLAWSVDSRRLPQYDAPPAEREPDAATIALELTRLHWEAVALQDIGDGRDCEAAQGRVYAIHRAARACGHKVESAFLAAIAGGVA